MSANQRMQKYTVVHLNRKHRSKNENFITQNNMDDSQTQKCWAEWAGPKKLNIIGYDIL